MIDYEYIPDKMNTIVARGWWVYLVNPQIVGTWTGTNASAAYELAIGRDGQATLKTSGITESGVVEHNVQEWRCCINEDNPNMMYAQAPLHGDDWMLDIALARN